MKFGFMELVLVLVIVLVLFGAGKLPKVMGDFGKGVRALKDGLKEEEKPVDTAKIPAPEEKKEV